MYCPINGCPAGAYAAVYGFCALLIGAIVTMLGIEEGWWKHLRALWNYDPVAMQAKMLREVWDEYRLLRIFPISYRMISQRNARKSPLELFKLGIITCTEVKAAAERGELH